MPVVSQAQRRWAYATMEGKTSAPASVGREFVEASHGITGLPARKHKQAGARADSPAADFLRYLSTQYGAARQKPPPPPLPPEGPSPEEMERTKNLPPVFIRRGGQAGARQKPRYFGSMSGGIGSR